MSPAWMDALRALGWSGLGLVAITGCIGLRRAGVATTYVRDLLHVGAGVWILGWSGWRSSTWPMILTLLVLIAIALIPLAAKWIPPLASFRDSVSNDDERWTGLWLYALSFTAFTWLGLHGRPVAAASALWALTLGDGIGGTVGRRFGKNFFTMPGGKRKSLEGSTAVALAAGLGALAAGFWFGAPLAIYLALAVGLTAAVAEALAPRGSDNLIVPIAVYALLRILEVRLA